MSQQKDEKSGELTSVEGLKFFQRLEPLLANLRDANTQRDKAGNRRLFFDQVCGLILLTFFNPTLKTLRDVVKASRLKQVQKKIKCNEVALGSVSEAMQVFDPELLVEIIQELLAQIPHSPSADPRLKELAHVPTAVDGSLLRQLPQVTQACFASRNDQGWKLHTHFEVLRGVPIVARVTDASGKKGANERAVLRNTLEKDRCYITDRGYEEFGLFNAIVAAGSSYVCRVQNNHELYATQSNLLSEEAVKAGVLEDTVGRMGSPNSKRIEHPNHTQRRIVVQVEPHPKRGGRKRQAATHDIVLITNLVDVPAEIIVLLYRFRWLIELFFRWLKCVLSTRHLMSQSENGLQIQMYCALIACLMIQLAAGPVKPDAWMYKLLCLYQQGWASEEEVLAYIEEQKAAAQKNAK